MVPSLWQPSGKTALCLALLAASAFCQSAPGRLAYQGSGRAGEARLEVFGTMRFEPDPAKDSRSGRRLAISPSEDAKAIGFVLERLSAHLPTELVIGVDSKADGPIDFELRLDDHTPHGGRWDRAVIPLRVERGPNLLRVPLSGQKGRERPMDFRQGIRRLQFSSARTRKSADLLVDGVWFVGEPEAAAIERRLPGLFEEEEKAARALHNADRSRKEERRRALEEVHLEISGALAALPEERRVRGCLPALEAIGDRESLRRTLRESLSGLSDKEAILTLNKAFERNRRTEFGPELSFALATTDSKAERDRLLAMLTSKDLPTTESKAAVLRGLTRRDDPDFARLLAQASRVNSWPLQAVLLQALRNSSRDFATDPLVGFLDRAGSERLRHDAADALRVFYGRDFGPDAKAWKRFLEAQRAGRTSPAEDQNAYGRFYGIPVVPGRIAFVIDVSGSMKDPILGGRAKRHIATAEHLKGQTIETRLALAQAELAHAIASLPETSEVGLIAYSDSASWLGAGLKPATPAWKKELDQRVRSLSAGGATNIHDGMLLAFHHKRKPSPNDILEGADTIYLVTDGDPSAGPVTERDALRDALLRWNLGRALKINTINVGPGRRDWMQEVSEESGGVFLDLTSKD